MANECALDTVLVRRRLAELGLSQRAFAEELDFELRTFQRWMAGARVGTTDAERIARRLGRGMGAVCCELPEDYAASPLEQLGPVLRWLERRGTPIGKVILLFEAYWKEWASLLEFHAQPLDRYVARFSFPDEVKHTFVPFRIHVPGRNAMLRFHGQALPRIRYAFGQIAIEGDRARLEEYVFTRALDGTLHDAALRVDIWLNADLRELVVTSDDPFEMVRLDEPPTREFDRSRPELAGAVCFRPPAADLRLAGLPPWDDRMR